MSDCDPSEECAVGLYSAECSNTGVALPTSNMQCGDVSVNESSDVHIGHKLIYNGPVVIKQYIQSPTSENCHFPWKPPSEILPQNAAPLTFNERFKERKHWLAMPPRGQIEPLVVSPVEYVVIAHTAGSTYQDPISSKNAVRHIQASHFNRGMFDIGYNFVIGDIGSIYEGRGWDKQGSFSPLVESKAICVAFMGDFTFELPSPAQVEAAFVLFEEGVKIGKLSPDYKILVHKQVKATESPGMVFIEEIMKWPKWGSLD